MFRADARLAFPVRVDFYFDPVCPWCWITSRWLVDVAAQRDIAVRWRPFSLLLKNGSDPDDPDGAPRSHVQGLRALRVVAAAADAHGDETVGPLYTRLGARYHHDQERTFDLATVLEAVGLPAALAAAAQDSSWDSVIEASMKEALAVAGEDVGVPLIVFDGERGFFGPIISKAPTGTAAAEMFDHVAALASFDGFWELKRDRTADPEFGPRP